MNMMYQLLLAGKQNLVPADKGVCGTPDLPEEDSSKGSGDLI